MRSVFVAGKLGELAVHSVEIEFDWHPGFALSQKQKSIASLHQKAAEQGILSTLEISSKSTEECGVEASAFNLSITTKKGKTISVESLFQGSKVFQNGGPYTELYDLDPRSAKKRIRELQSGDVTKFILFNKEEHPIKPRTLFYDWLYIKALAQNPAVADRIAQFDAFTDIEFNPKKSLNCQAFSAALYCTLRRNDLVDEVRQSSAELLRVADEVYSRREHKDWQPALL